MLWSDSRTAWDATSLSDQRVLHYWDGELSIGQWFARNVDGYDGTAWDVYYLYGPEAEWEDLPTSLIGSGYTIYGERQSLQTQIQTLLGK